METLSPEVVEDLRHGRATRERKLAVCTGGAHLEPTDRAEILAVLAGDPDEMIANRASEAILSVPAEFFCAGYQARKRFASSFCLCLAESGRQARNL